MCNSIETLKDMGNVHLHELAQCADLFANNTLIILIVNVGLMREGTVFPHAVITYINKLKYFKNFSP